MAITVTAASPVYGENDKSALALTLTGTGFTGSPTVVLSKTGETSITASSVVVVSATSITCVVDLTGAAFGTWTITVTIGVDTDTESFEVIPPIENEVDLHTIGSPVLDDEVDVITNQ